MTHPSLPAAPGDAPDAHERLFTIEATPVKFGPGAALDAGWELKRLGAHECTACITVLILYLQH